MATYPILPFVPQDVSAIPVEVKPLHPEDSARRLSLHGHLFFEMLVVTAGSGAITLDGIQHQASPGCVFTIPPFLPHDVSKLGSSSGWALLFLPAGVAETSQATSGLSLLDNIPLGMAFDQFRNLQSPDVPLHLEDDSLAKVEQLCRKIHAELQGRAYGYDFAVRAALQLILVEVGRAAGPVGTASQEDAHIEQRALIARVFKDIDQHFNTEPSLARAARRLGLSAGHLTTRLRRLTGRTYGDWVVERKMMEARHRLAYSSQTLAEIADHIGYESLESFIRRFRAHHSTTPSRWRQKIRQERNPQESA
ncbi:MAG: helix-turn-helix domain-containing protein [Acidobacteriaceae bacterium]